MVEIRADNPDVHTTLSNSSSSVGASLTATTVSSKGIGSGRSVAFTDLWGKQGYTVGELPVNAAVGVAPEAVVVVDQDRDLFGFTSCELRNGADRSLLTVESGKGFPVADVQQMIKQARHSISVIVPSDKSEADVLCRAFDEVADKICKKVRRRFLSSKTSLSFDCVERIARTPENELRVADQVVGTSVIVDGEIVITRSYSDTSDTRTSRILTGVVPNFLESLFDGIFLDSHAPAWNGGVSFSDGRLECVLKLLRAGRLDDAAARELGVSLRTYRRRVAAIMRSLGARSRFQAGARAVETGSLACFCNHGISQGS